MKCGSVRLLAIFCCHPVTCHHPARHPAPNPLQGPGLKSWHWRKSSQWFGMLRSHAQLVLEDSEVFRK